MTFFFLKKENIYIYKNAQNYTRLNFLMSDVTLIFLLKCVPITVLYIFWKQYRHFYKNIDVYKKLEKKLRYNFLNAPPPSHYTLFFFQLKETLAFLHFSKILICITYHSLLKKFSNLFSIKKTKIKKFLKIRIFIKKNFLELFFYDLHV